MKILLVEDDGALARTIRRGLEAEGMVVDVAHRADDAMVQARELPYDALVVDRRLPDGDGLDLIRRLRSEGSRVPVLMLTARAELVDRVEGLEAGADDYLAKPFAFSELVARVRALARRAQGEFEAEPELKVGDLKLDRRAQRLTVAGSEVPLTPREYSLLETMMAAPDALLTRTRLADSAWDWAADYRSNVVDVYVGYLRRKLADASSSVRLETVRGRGYRLRPADPAP